MGRWGVVFGAILVALGPRVSAQQPAVVALDEMEGLVNRRWKPLASAEGPTLEPDTEVVKDGEQSGRWDPEVGARQMYLDPEGMPTDWASLGALELWVHSEKATGAVFAIAAHSENPDVDGEDYYRCLIPVDWEGWRFLHLEPRSFSVGREPLGWDSIDSLRLAISGWADLKYVPGTVLRFDALRLVAVQPDPERRVLFEPDTDWCAWWPLTYATQPVQTGRYVSEWHPADRRDDVVNRSVPGNWSGSTYLNLWLHSEKNEGSTLLVSAVSDSLDTEQTDGYQAGVELDWEGWRLLTVALTDFLRVSEPRGWHEVDALRLAVRSETALNEDARICIDDIWLSTLAGPAAQVADTSPGGGGAAPTVTAPGGNGTTGPEPTPPDPEPDIAELLKEALEAKRAGDLELSFTKYITALLHEPDHVGAHWGLAWVLAAKSEKEAACEHFRQVVELSQDPEQVKEAKAALTRLQGGD